MFLSLQVGLLLPIPSIVRAKPSAAPFPNQYCRNSAPSGPLAVPCSNSGPRRPHSLLPQAHRPRLLLALLALRPPLLLLPLQLSNLNSPHRVLRQRLNWASAKNWPTGPTLLPTRPLRASHTLSFCLSRTTLPLDHHLPTFNSPSRRSSHLSAPLPWTPPCCSRLLLRVRARP